VSRQNVREAPSLLENVFMLYPDLVALDAAFGCEALGVVAVDVAPDYNDLKDVVALYTEKMRSLRGRSNVRFMCQYLVRRAQIMSANMRRLSRTGQCFAGHAYLYVDPSGAVCDCPVASRCMGELREFDFNIDRLLKSEGARRVRFEVKHSDCCCTMSAPALSNIFLSPNDYIKLAGSSL
jgi:hypothetical protein